jgi:hypothetical protein
MHVPDGVELVVPMAVKVVQGTSVCRCAGPKLRGAFEMPHPFLQGRLQRCLIGKSLWLKDVCKG